MVLKMWLWTSYISITWERLLGPTGSENLGVGLLDQKTWEWIYLIRNLGVGPAIHVLTSSPGSSDAPSTLVREPVT